MSIFFDDLRSTVHLIISAEFLYLVIRSHIYLQISVYCFLEASFFEAYDSYYRLNITNSNLHRENERLTKTNEKLAGENENLRAENRIYDERNGLWYAKQGDYYLPELALPSEKEKPIGICRQAGSNRTAKGRKSA